jgi:hypothetical protein
MKTLYTFLFLCLSFPAMAQVGINNVGAAPHASAMLDISSTNRGLLVPRMTMAQRNAIVTPATGLMVFQTDNTPGYFYNAGTPAAPVWSMLGGTASPWLTNGSYVYYNGGNVGIGTHSPAALLHTIGTGPGEGNILFAGTFKSTKPGAPPVAGAGTRFMWYPDKAALRAGQVTATQWDKDSIGEYSFALGYNAKAKGFGAYSFGNLSSASNNAAIAIGQSTIASGQTSLSLGNATVASGLGATAIGYAANATGTGATAIGHQVFAPSAYEFVVGRWNADYTPASITAWSDTDRLFVVGKGTNPSTRSNAITVLKSGNTGIGTDVPAALLHTNGTGTGGGNVLLAGMYKSSSPGNPPASGAGTRMMWYPDKGAFRVGGVTGLQWDKDSTGNYSIALGYNTKAKANLATAMGAGTTASGDWSTAMGDRTTASGTWATAMGEATKAIGVNSTAMGYNTTASGFISLAMGSTTTASGERSTAIGTVTTASGISSTAMGRRTTASGDFSTAMGEGTKALGNHSTSMGINTTALGVASLATGDGSAASGTYSTAMGFKTTASGNYSTAMGESTTASGDYSTAMGESSTASGSRSTAMGFGTIALAIGSTAMGGVGTTASGQYSTAMGAGTTASGLTSVAMGAGTTASGDRSTAMGSNSRAVGDHSFAINLHGITGPDVGTRTFQISGAAAIGGNLAWTNHSDSRLKKDIQYLQTENNLQKIMKLNAVRYRWREYNDQLNLGFIAQEVENIVPEAVRYDEANDIYSMEYNAIIPVLVEAMKEQQYIIKELKAVLAEAIKELKAENDTLKKSNENLEARLYKLEKLLIEKAGH